LPYYKDLSRFKLLSHYSNVDVTLIISLIQWHCVKIKIQEEKFTTISCKRKGKVVPVHFLTENHT